MRDNIKYMKGKSRAWEHIREGSLSIALDKIEYCDKYCDSNEVIGYLDGLIECLSEMKQQCEKEKEDIERLLDEIKIEKADRQSEAQEEYFEDNVTEEKTNE